MADNANNVNPVSVALVIMNDVNIRIDSLLLIMNEELCVSLGIVFFFFSVNIFITCLVTRRVKDKKTKKKFTNHAWRVIIKISIVFIYINQES